MLTREPTAAWDGSFAVAQDDTLSLIFSQPLSEVKTLFACAFLAKRCPESFASLRMTKLREQGKRHEDRLKPVLHQFRLSFPVR